MSENPFIQKALAAIQKADYEMLEGLRDEIRPEHIPGLVATWNAALPWGIKDGYIALLMDQTGESVRPIMEDALNSPTAESQAYALCILKGDFGFFEQLMTGGSVDAKKVEAAVAQYRPETRRKNRDADERG